MSLTLPRFYPIVDTVLLRARGWDPVTVAEVLLAAGVRILQYRHKAVWEESDFQEAKQLCRLAREAGALYVVNDRADFALLLNAAVHVGQDDLPPAAVRKVMGRRILGFSTHNAPQLQRGDREDVDYLALGPIFGTKSKLKPDPVVGLDGLRRLRTVTGKPLVAIGGISLEQAPAVLAAGADSVAVIGGWLPPTRSMDDLRRQVEDWSRL